MNLQSVLRVFSLRPGQLKLALLGSGLAGLGLYRLLYAIGLDGRGLLKSGHFAWVLLCLVSIAAGVLILSNTLRIRGVGGRPMHSIPAAIACVAAARGYRTIIVMPGSMSAERQMLMGAYGAELVLTLGAEGMTAAIAKAEELAKKIPGSFIPNQFRNPANAQAHYKTTGPEIWEDTDGHVDIFVATVGTGGTITGTGRYLKDQNPNVKVVAVEPADSPLLSQGRAGHHGIQGVGANFIPKVLDTGIYDQILTATLEESFGAGQLLGTTEGILCGISSGAALHAAIELAKQPENSGKNIVVLLPDTGERYLSTAMFRR